MNLRAKISGSVAILVVVAGLLPAASASGNPRSPIDDKRAEAANLSRQIDAANSKINDLSQRVDAAESKLENAEKNITITEARTEAAQEASDALHDQVSAQAASVYMGAAASSPLDMINIKDIQELATRSQYAAAATDHDNQLLNKYQKAREVLAAQRSRLEKERAEAQHQENIAISARRQAQATENNLKSVLAQTNADIKNMIDEQHRQELAAQQAAARAQSNDFSNGGGGGGGAIPANFPNVPAPSSAAAVAVAYAERQVGKPYVFATHGPNTFDCSGLTGEAWAVAGHPLTFYSGAQYQETIRIGPGDLRPGDLVFYGPGGSRHVEIYIGGGQVVSAADPQDGVIVAGVRYGSASGYGRVP
ncbi:MAG TPA: NlpC/P60 family protein [Acidimicrobiia bacterium]